MEENLRHNLGDAEAYTVLSNAVYLISIGGNDYFAPFATNCSFFETHSQEEYVGMVIGNLTNVIKVLNFFFSSILLQFILLQILV
jgi:hypothetical protein